MTNGDVIRSMTDAELAYELSDVGCPITLTCPYDYERQPTDEMCQKCWEKWLGQEAKTGGQDDGN